jgi:hypothetical protein
MRRDFDSMFPRSRGASQTRDSGQMNFDVSNVHDPTFEERIQRLTGQTSGKEVKAPSLPNAKSEMHLNGQSLKIKDFQERIGDISPTFLAQARLKENSMKQSKSTNAIASAAT